ncbi:MAG: guanylate kinase [Lachnospiraceae bacterium]|nr:guanylate kinase [Lachnospiraceae bacterium]
MDKGILVVISGFSGAGKGTVVKKLLSESDEYCLSVSMTTRAPRPGEVDGKDYFFVTKEKFEQTIAENGLIEHAQFVGNYYGTPRAYVEQKINEGKNVILEIEIQGAMNIKKIYPESVLLFITPPTGEELERRLKGRGTETEDVIAGRLSRASEESAGIGEYDYIVINDDLDKCVADVMETIRSAKRKPARQETFIEELRKGLEKYHR